MNTADFRMLTLKYGNAVSVTSKDRRTARLNVPATTKLLMRIPLGGRSWFEAQYLARRQPLDSWIVVLSKNNDQLIRRRRISVY